jgi:hypothetical protein
VSSNLRRITMCLAAIWLGFASAASAAYDLPLDSESIREAYFLGRRNDEKTIKFLASYIKRLPSPEKGPHISEISLYTPYAQIVLNSSRNASLDSAQQAEQEYRTLGDTIHIRVVIEFTPTFNAMVGVRPDKDAAGKEALVRRSDDFWREFQYELRQNKNVIKPRSMGGKPIYSDSGFSGAEVQLEYDAKSVASEETTFEVSTQDDHHVTAQFDLSELR